MALTWNIQDCDDAIKAEEYSWDVTEGLIFTTIGVGINHITKENAEEFWTRMDMQAMAYGNPGTGTTLEQVREHIGLKTNASPKTKTAFHGQITRLLRERAQLHREAAQQ